MSEKKEEVKKTGLYTAGLVLGIIAVCMFLNPFIAFICGILALIFGAVSYSKGYKKKIPMILGILGMVIAITEVVLLIVFRQQIIDNFENNSKKVINHVGTEFIDTIEDMAEDEKEQLSDDTKEDLNRAIDEIERTFRSAIDSNNY